MYIAPTTYYMSLSKYDNYCANIEVTLYYYMETSTQYTIELYSIVCMYVVSILAFPSPVLYYYMWPSKLCFSSLQTNHHLIINTEY